MNETRHRQIALTAPDGQPVWVDEGMAELLSRCWQLGLHTEYSCQESPRDGKGYILFARAEDAARFISWAAGPPSDDPHSLFARARSAGHSEPQAHPAAWELWSTLVDDANPQWWHRRPSLQPAACRLRMSVRFPAGDRQAILSNLLACCADQVALRASRIPVDC